MLRDGNDAQCHCTETGKASGPQTRPSRAPEGPGPQARRVVRGLRRGVH